MLNEREREAIAGLWAEKLAQDARGLPRHERHRNLEPGERSPDFVGAA